MRIFGTWKNRLGLRESTDLARDLAGWLESRPNGGSEIVVLPPMIALASVRDLLGDPVSLFSQNAVWDAQNAFTGETSVQALSEIGCQGVMVGHSERRTHLGETDHHVVQKVESIVAHGLEALVCVGETYDERRAGSTENVLEGQLRGLLPVLNDHDDLVSIAYEPAWAITTNEEKLPADAEVAEQVHGWLREFLEKEVGSKGRGIKLIYGAGVNADNAASFAILENVDGILVGSASQQLDSFRTIVESVDEKVA